MGKRTIIMIWSIALCLLGCGEYETTGDAQDKSESLCDAAVSADVYKCVGKTRVVCKSGASWVDTSGAKLGTVDCAVDGLVCHEAKLADGTVFDAYCTQCTEGDLSNCKVADDATMVPVCLDNGFEGMVCDFECRPGYVRTDAGTCEAG